MSERIIRSKINFLIFTLPIVLGLAVPRDTAYFYRESPIKYQVVDNRSETIKCENARLNILSAVEDCERIMRSQTLDLRKACNHKSECVPIFSCTLREDTSPYDIDDEEDYVTTQNKYKNTVIKCAENRYIDVRTAVYGYGWNKVKEVRPINVVNEVRKLCQHQDICTFNSLILKLNKFPGDANYFVVTFSCKAVTDKCYKVECGLNSHCIAEKDSRRCECDEGSILQNNQCIDMTDYEDPRHKSIILYGFDISMRDDENDDHVGVFSGNASHSGEAMTRGKINAESGSVILDDYDMHFTTGGTPVYDASKHSDGPDTSTESLPKLSNHDLGGTTEGSDLSTPARNSTSSQYSKDAMANKTDDSPEIHGATLSFDAEKLPSSLENDSGDTTCNSGNGGEDIQRHKTAISTDRVTLKETSVTKQGEVTSENGTEPDKCAPDTVIKPGVPPSEVPLYGVHADYTPTNSASSFKNDVASGSRRSDGETTAILYSEENPTDPHNVPDKRGKPATEKRDGNLGKEDELIDVDLNADYLKSNGNNGSDVSLQGGRSDYGNQLGCKMAPGYDSASADKMEEDNGKNRCVLEQNNSHRSKNGNDSECRVSKENAFHHDDRHLGMNGVRLDHMSNPDKTGNPRTTPSDTNNTQIYASGQNFENDREAHGAAQITTPPGFEPEEKQASRLTPEIANGGYIPSVEAHSKQKLQTIEDSEEGAKLGANHADHRMCHSNGKSTSENDILSVSTADSDPYKINMENGVSTPGSHTSVGKARDEGGRNYLSNVGTTTPSIEDFHQGTKVQYDDALALSEGGLPPYDPDDGTSPGDNQSVISGNSRICDFERKTDESPAPFCTTTYDDVSDGLASTSSTIDEMPHRGVRSDSFDPAAGTGHSTLIRSTPNNTPEQSGNHNDDMFMNESVPYQVSYERLDGIDSCHHGGGQGSTRGCYTTENKRTNLNDESMNQLYKQKWMNEAKISSSPDNYQNRAANSMDKEPVCKLSQNKVPQHFTTLDNSGVADTEPIYRGVTTECPRRKKFLHPKSCRLQMIQGARDHADENQLQKLRNVPGDSTYNATGSVASCYRRLNGKSQMSYINHHSARGSGPSAPPTVVGNIREEVTSFICYIPKELTEIYHPAADYIQVEVKEDLRNEKKCRYRRCSSNNE
ncbi:uncharacterized protein BXIN_0625 [Babesia sp. Xinjiang]|uniref:uncharacterized protein n=1 Tax=Babesia sp. Xinjiang TaxID=462227 RepID=UPI000A245694|nr:uncharacterized protein BXIN_0625 [Babesia sp. Xinjiang]ORM41818.1 hypothetical protein BXIN_0625 [Babesia sp. Xinjiang]